MVKINHEALISEFPSKVAKLSNDLRTIAASFKNSDTIMEAEHLLYHTRQDLVDYKLTMSAAISDLQKDYRIKKSERMRNHKENKLEFRPATPTETKIFDEAHFTIVIDTIEKFDHQLTWAQDSIKTCDEMANGISYHIKLAQLLGGTKR